MLIVLYPSKKDLKAAKGQTLRYQETSIFGPEYRSTGTFTACNRPHITGMGKEFFAEITMENDKIIRVS